MPAWLRSVAIVIVALGLATLLTFPLERISIHSLELFFMAAVIVAARLAGPYSGLVSAVLAVLIFDWFFDQNPQSFNLNLAGGVRVIVFCSVAFLVTSLETQRRRALHSLQNANRALQAALDEIRTLRGILPICMHCKQIRDAEGHWVRLEKYVQEHSHAEFTHGLCPECFQKHYPDYQGTSSQP
jgi:K+-sensing histidine kinase KdpD